MEDDALSQVWKILRGYKKQQQHVQQLESKCQELAALKESVRRHASRRRRAADYRPSFPPRPLMGLYRALHVHVREYREEEGKDSRPLSRALPASHPPL